MKILDFQRRNEENERNDFFKRYDIQIIKGMLNGKDYILFYLRLLCKGVNMMETYDSANESRITSRCCRLCEGNYDFRKLVVYQCVEKWDVGFRGTLSSCSTKDKISFCPECGRKLTDEDFESKR